MRRRVEFMPARAQQRPHLLHAQPADQAPCATRNVAIACFSLSLFVGTRNEPSFW